MSPSFWTALSTQRRVRAPNMWLLKIRLLQANRKLDLASQPSRYFVVGIWKQQAYPERTTSGVKHRIDHLYGRSVSASHRLLSGDDCFHPNFDDVIKCYRHENLDVQRIDLRDCHDRRLFVSVLASDQAALGNNAIDRADNNSLPQNLRSSHNV